MLLLTCFSLRSTCSSHQPAISSVYVSEKMGFQQSRLWLSTIPIDTLTGGFCMSPTRSGRITVGFRDPEDIRNLLWRPEVWKRHPDTLVGVVAGVDRLGIGHE